MTYYNAERSRDWYYQVDAETVYAFGIYQEEYPDGSSHPVIGSKREITGVSARRRREDAEEVEVDDVPDIVVDRVEELGLESKA